LFPAEGDGPITEFEKESRRRRLRLVVIAYPFVLILIALGMNALLFGISPLVMTLPAKEVLAVLAASAALLLINHSWLMTATELTRSRYGLHATPEEWAAAKADRSLAPAEGQVEVERCQNAHRNTTENTVYFVFLAVLMALGSPAYPAVIAWIGGYGLARLGYTYCYLSGRSALRGLFMSLGLLSLYGMASYLLLALLY